MTDERVAGRTLVEPDLFHKLADRLVRDEALARPLAGRIIDQALAFLKACADNPDAGLAPSKLVDLGWHTFVLHTRDYTEFCQRLAGRFIHHVPTDPDPSGDANPQAGPGVTVTAIENVGMTVDYELWHLSSGEPTPPQPRCHQCHAGCHDSA